MILDSLLTKCQTKIESNLPPLQDEAVVPRPDNDGVPTELPAGNFAARWRCQDISLDERSKKQHQLHPVLRLYKQEKIFSCFLVDRSYQICVTLPAAVRRIYVSLSQK